MTISVTLAVGYLSALIDGEGCVAFYDYRQKKPARIQRHITIQMCDVEVLDFAERCFARLGVDCHRHKRIRGDSRRDCFILTVKPNYRNVKKLASCLALKHEGKRQRLAAMAESFSRIGCSVNHVAELQEFSL